MFDNHILKLRNLFVLTAVIMFGLCFAFGVRAHEQEKPLSPEAVLESRTELAYETIWKNEMHLTGKVLPDGGMVYEPSLTYTKASSPFVLCGDVNADFIASRFI